MMIRLQENTMHNHLFDKHLCNLIEKGLDMSAYMESQLSISRIRDSNFPSNHCDDSFMIKGVSYDSPQEVIANYEEIFGKHL